MAAAADITAESKLGEVLDRWPALEALLVELSPRFQGLENPLVRRTLGRVATLRQVAIAGAIPVPVLLERMRAAAGLPPLAVSTSTPENAGERPAWAYPAAATHRRDARLDVGAGNHPLPLVMEGLEAMGDGDIYELITPFVPAPLIDLARRKGFESHPVTEPPEPFVRTYFRRMSAPAPVRSE